MSEARITGTTDPEDNGGNSGEVTPQTPPTPAPAKAEATPPEPDEPKVGKDGVVELEKPVDEPKEPAWLQRRINKAVAEREAALREVADLRIKLADFGKPKEGDPAPTKTADPGETERQIHQRAAEMAFNSECQRLARDGIKEYPQMWTRGIQDLNEKAMMDNESISIILEQDNPTKVFMALAQDLDESSRIFSLGDARAKTRELTKFAIKLDAPPPKSNRTRAPDPIEPKIGGPGKQDVDLESSNTNDREWIAERERQVKEKRKTDKRLR